MSKVRKRESGATFRCLGNWVDFLSWRRWGWRVENRFDDENQVPHTEHASGDAAQGVEGTGWGDAGTRHQKAGDGMGEHAGRGEPRTKSGVPIL